MAKAICICGKICSGKSTYAEKLRTEKQAVLLSIDEITLALFPQHIGEKHDEYVEKTERYLFEKSLEIIEIGVNVILDWGFWSKEERNAAKEFYIKHNTECEFHCIDIDDETWKARLKKRNSAVLDNKISAYYVDENIAEKFKRLYEKPQEDEIDVWVRASKLGCIIMASGLGKRFGGNKLMADFNGKPLIQWTLEATEGIFARRVVVTRHKDVEQLCKQQGIPVIYHELPNRNDTIRLGLEYLGDTLDGYMICQSDQPLLRRESIESIAQSANSSRELIFRAAFGDVAAAPALFPKWSFDELLHLPEGKGGRVVMMKHPEMVRTVQVQDMYELQDVDTPEDLGELRRKSKWNI